MKTKIWVTISFSIWWKTINDYSVNCKVFMLFYSFNQQSKACKVFFLHLPICTLIWQSTIKTDCLKETHWLFQTFHRVTTLHGIPHCPLMPLTPRLSFSRHVWPTRNSTLPVICKRLQLNRLSFWWISVFWTSVCIRFFISLAYQNIKKKSVFF